MIPKSLRQIHLKELSFTECLRGTFDLWRFNFSAIVLVFASISIPIALINHVLALKITGTNFVLISSCINAVSHVLTALASARIAESFLLGNRLNYAEAIKLATQKFVPGLIVGILFEVGLTIATVLLIVPGLFFMIFFVFALPSVILRGTSGFDAFQYSYALSKKSVSPIFVKLLGVAAVVIGLWFTTMPLVFLQTTFPSLLSGILLHVLFSFPTLLIILLYLNYDYLQNGFPGSMDDASEVSELSQFSLKPGDLMSQSLSALQDRAHLQQKHEEEKKKSSSGLLESKLFKDFSNRFLKNKDTKDLEDLRKLETESPHDMRIKQKIAEVYYRLNRTDEAANIFLDVARNFEAENFLLKAIKTYKNILQIKPDLIEINLKLADLYKKMNMPHEAANQFRIAITAFAMVGNKEKALELSEQLVRIDPSQENKTKLAEIYQMNGMKDEALKQYEDLAKLYRAEKKYDKLLHIYELILPHRPGNTAIIKDICILHLRNQNPNRCLQIIDQYKLAKDTTFKDLVDKAHLMIEVLKRQKTG